MASILQVEQIKGPTSGASANTITIPSGQTLEVAGDWTPPAGTVVQVVNTVNTTHNISTTSSTWADASLSVTITPTATTSKILLLVSVNGIYKSSANTALGLRIVNDYGDSTKGIGTLAAYTNSTGTSSVGGESVSFLYTPNTTSAITYSLQFSNLANSGTAYYNTRYNTTFTDVSSTITAMEIIG